MDVDEQDPLIGLVRFHCVAQAFRQLSGLAPHT